MHAFAKILTTGAVLAGLGCSTAAVAPPPVAPVLPPLVQVPHPAGSDLGDLQALFLEPGAPRRDQLTGCADPFLKLKSATASRDELRTGTREIVAGDPVALHWCFYGKLLELEEGLKKEPYVEERQKTVVDTYGFLVPIARGFQAEFRDSRYLRMAIGRYRRLSEWVFFRKVEMSKETTSLLAEIENPFGVWRAPAEMGSVLKKYGIEVGDPKATLVAPPETAPLSPERAGEPVSVEQEIQPEAPTL